MIDAAGLKLIGGPRAKPTIINGLAKALPYLAPAFGLDRPHRLAHFLSQCSHESAGFSTTREIWGPTAAQKRYEGRKDLGNVKKGDGAKFKGHGLIQTTGRANHAEFTKWVRARKPDAPDFTATPEKLEEFPWALMAALMYWDTRKLNALADANNAEQITKKINGGLNGYADRLEGLGRALLVLSGYGITKAEIERAQEDSGLDADGDMGPATRQALFNRLKGDAVALVPTPRPRPIVEPDMDDEMAAQLRHKTKVQDVQRSLVEFGYQTGGIDGQIGTLTTAALAAYRFDRHLPPAEGVDDALIADMIRAADEGFTRPIPEERADKPATEIAKESVTMKVSWWGRILLWLGIPAGVAGQAAEEAVNPDQLETRLSFLQRMSHWALDNATLLIVLGVVLGGGFVAFKVIDRLKVNAYRSGARA